MSLHDILHLWTIRAVDGGVTDLTFISMEHLYPLSPLQRAILVDIMGTLTGRRQSQEDGADSSWQKYRVLLGKPGTGKSQVLIHAIDYAIQNEMSVLAAAPVALLTQGYTKIFLGDIEADTLHGAFNIPVDGTCSGDINYGLNKFDMVVIDESSMISSRLFDVMAATTIDNRLNLRPVVIFAGDKCQQQPLQTVDGRTCATTSIINDHTFNAVNTVHHTLYQQFRITDPTYATFLDCIRFTQPTQQQVDLMQEGIMLCPPGPLTDEQIWQAYTIHSHATVMTVSRHGAQCVNNIVVDHLFSRMSLVKHRMRIGCGLRPHISSSKHASHLH